MHTFIEWAMYIGLGITLLYIAKTIISYLLRPEFEDIDDDDDDFECKRQKFLHNVSKIYNDKK